MLERSEEKDEALEEEWERFAADTSLCRLDIRSLYGLSGIKKSRRRGVFVRYPYIAACAAAVVALLALQHIFFTGSTVSSTCLVAASEGKSGYNLPDGSYIWLNSGARLYYDDNLGVSGTKKVRLEGEAFFDVEKSGRPFVVDLDGWFPLRERGTFYGFFSASHNFGEGLSFLFVGLLVALAGWQWGFFGAAAAGLIGAAIIIFFLHDTPESRGLPPIEELSGEKPSSSAQSGGRENTREIQKQVLANPTVWILALASAFMYISRYAVNGWGVLFLQEAKGFSLTEATGLISVNAWFGIIGTVFSGWLSDKVFRGDRNRPALIFGIMNTAALCLFLYGGDSWAVNVAAMVLFGTAIGVLICFLGGLMAVDIVPRKASGAALGIVGIMSYVAAGERKSSCGRQKYVLSFSERRLKLF